MTKTLNELTICDLGSEAGPDDLAAFKCAAQILMDEGCAPQDAIDWLWGSGDCWPRVVLVLGASSSEITLHLFAEHCVQAGDRVPSATFDPDSDDFCSYTGRPVELLAAAINRPYSTYNRSILRSIMVEIG